MSCEKRIRGFDFTLLCINTAGSCQEPSAASWLGKPAAGSRFQGLSCIPAGSRDTNVLGHSESCRFKGSSGLEPQAGNLGAPSLLLSLSSKYCNSSSLRQRSAPRWRVTAKGAHGNRTNAIRKALAPLLLQGPCWALASTTQEYTEGALPAGTAQTR